MTRGPMHEVNLKLMLGAMALIMGAGLSFFIVGETLSFLATGHFTGTRVTQGLWLGVAMLTKSSQPAAAWPEGSRPSLSAGTFWTLWLIFFAALAYQLSKRWGQITARATNRKKPPKSAQWASSHDLQKLIVKGASKGRIVLGRFHGKLLAAQPKHSVALFGPTQTGKTTSVVIPAILEWDGPALITSVKTDLMDDTIASRRSKGECFVFDPAQVVGMHRRHQWTPLARSKTFEGAQKTAEALVMSAQQAMGGADQNDFWFKHAKTLLGPILYAAALGEKDMGTVLQWLDQKETLEVAQELFDVVDGLDNLPISTLKGIQSMGPEQRDSVYLTAMSVLEIYRSPKVLDTARRSEITPEILLDGGCNTAYLCAPISEQKKLAPAYATLIKEMVDWAYEMYTKTGQPLDPPLLIMLDEAANIAPLHQLDEIASTAAGVGIQLVTAFQDLGQVRERWGHDKAQTIVSNHRARMVLPGIACEHTLDWVHKVTGDQEVRQTSYTDGHHSKSVTDATAHRHLLPANVVREMKDGEALLIYGNVPPTKLDLRPWFADKELCRIVEDAKANDPARFVPPTGEFVSKEPPKNNVLLEERIDDLVDLIGEPPPIERIKELDQKRHASARRGQHDAQRGDVSEDSPAEGNDSDNSFRLRGPAAEKIPASISDTSESG